MTGNKIQNLKNLLSGRPNLLDQPAATIKQAYFEEHGETVGDTAIREAKKIVLDDMNTEPEITPADLQSEDPAVRDAAIAYYEAQTTKNAEEYNAAHPASDDPEPMTAAEINEVLDEMEAEPDYDAKQEVFEAPLEDIEDGPVEGEAEFQDEPVISQAPTFGEPKTSEEHAAFYDNGITVPETTEPEPVTESKQPKVKTGYTSTHPKGTVADTSQRCPGTTTSGPCVRPLNHGFGHMSQSVLDKKTANAKAKRDAAAALKKAAAAAAAPTVTEPAATVETEGATAAE